MRGHLIGGVRATIVVAALVVARAAEAAPTFTVNDTADLVDISPGNGICSATASPPYVCTLRAAMMEASHTSGLGATIVIPAGTFTLGISAAGSDDETTGDLNLTTPASGSPVITINGDSATTTIIDGNQIDRVLHVHAGRTVNISSLKIRNGYTTSDGAGILNEGTLTLTAVTIGGSDAEGNSAHSGGGVKNAVNAQLTVQDSTFSNNFAAVSSPNDSGGGLFNLGSADLTSTTFSNNYAIIYGGAIYSAAGALLYLDHSAVDNNFGIFGSGISNAGTAHVSASTITGNILDELGGGFYNTGTLDIHGSTISGNGSKTVTNGDEGGGIYNSGTLVVDTSVISGNVSYDGGGIFNALTGNLDVNTSTISGNGGQLTSSGGGIVNKGALKLAASTINNNTSAYGGGIQNSNAIFITNATISGNSSGANGGGIANVTASGVANLYNTTITLNVAGTASSGGGIYSDTASGAQFALRNTLVVNNYAPAVGQYNECTGSLHSYGNNLIGTGVGLPANCTVDTPSGGSWFALSPNSLGPLQDNGGPTWTHALLRGSNAIDGGDAAGCVNQNGPILTDQRGFLRTNGALCDIGAFEYDERIFKNGFE